MIPKTSEEIELIRHSCAVVADTLALIASEIRPGVTTLELDKIAEEYIHDQGGVPAFKGYKGFPNSICASPNDQVVHGIPNSTELSEGDIASIDVGVTKNGFVGDSAYTFAVQGTSTEVLELMRVTQEALILGVEQATVGHRVGDISQAIQHYCEKEHGYGCVRELVGHGVGRDLHEKPEIPNFGKRGRGPKLSEGLVIAIEPMINMGNRRVVMEQDGWTIRTKDGLPSAHFEHCIAVRKGPPDVLSRFDVIQEAVKNNPNLVSLN